MTDDVRDYINLLVKMALTICNHPCKTLILPVVSYGRETWSLMLKETRTLRVF